MEASISGGGDSQKKAEWTDEDGKTHEFSKHLGGEHPMWLVSAKSPFLTGRDSITGVGMIDQFFDDWLVRGVGYCYD